VSPPFVVVVVVVVVVVAVGNSIVGSWVFRVILPIYIDLQTSLGHAHNTAHGHKTQPLREMHINTYAASVDTASVKCEVRASREQERERGEAR